MNGWLDAGAFTLAASLAYYAIFSIAPLVLISIHLASLFLDRNAAVEGLTKELVGLIGPTGSDAIKQMLDAAGTAQPHGWTGLVGIAVLLFAAAGFVGSLQDALDKIWEASPRPDGVWSFRGDYRSDFTNDRGTLIRSSGANPVPIFRFDQCQFAKCLICL